MKIRFSKKIVYLLTTMLALLLLSCGEEQNSQSKTNTETDLSGQVRNEFLVPGMPTKSMHGGMMRLSP